MQLNASHKKVLQWIEAQQPVIGLFHVMTDLKPMIESGLVERRHVLPSKSQLVITDLGKAALMSLTEH
jgi:hypothetical protein